MKRGDSASGDLFVELGHATAPRIELPRSFDGLDCFIDAVEAKERARLQGIRTGGGREDLDEPLRPCERGRGLVLREPRLKPARDRGSQPRIVRERVDIALDRFIVMVPITEEISGVHELASARTAAPRAERLITLLNFGGGRDDDRR